MTRMSNVVSSFRYNPMRFLGALTLMIGVPSIAVFLMVIGEYSLGTVAFLFWAAIILPRGINAGVLRYLGL